MQELLKFLPFDEAFKLVCDSAHTDAGASWLAGLCEAFDLRRTECASAVETIASWIDSPNSGCRCEVVFALCNFRPVPGYEWIAIEGWKRAPIVDLHWYAGAIESSYTARNQVDARVIGAIAERLNRPTPTVGSYDKDYYAFFGEALADRAIELSDTSRALAHLAGLFCVEHPPLAQTEATDPRALEDSAAQWRAIAQQLMDSVIPGTA